METYQIDLIRDAFSRCHGLQENLYSMPQQAIFELSRQTGLVVGWLFEHRQEIINL